MIKSITITNHVDESITLTLRSPEQSGFFIRKIDGLSPPKATINIDEFLTDGGVYNSSRINTRNILLDLGFFYGMAGMSIEQIRDLSYKYFPVNKQLTISILTDRLIASTQGYVESNEIYIFSKEQGANISILCPYQFFTGFYDFDIPLTGLSSTFEFPLENPGLEAAIVLGEIFADLNIAYIDYRGNYETGVVLTATIGGSVTGLYFQETEKNQVITISDAKVTSITGGGIASGDVIVISTKQNDKYATLTRSAVEYNILAALFSDGTIDWLTLSRGDNYVKFGATTGVANVSVNCAFNLLYGGI